MNKVLLFLALSAFASSLFANEQLNNDLTNLVAKHQITIETAAAQEMNVPSLALELTSLQCLGQESHDVGLVGVCMASGIIAGSINRNLFSISVFDKYNEKEARGFKVVHLNSGL